MNWAAFEAEVARVMRSSYKVAELTPGTPLDGVDSLGIVEFITAAEEHLGIALSFEETREACGNYGALRCLIENRSAQ